jgi:hypothetical protein
VDAARRDRADPVLGLPGMPDLANGERIERRTEPLRDLCRDLDAAACEPDDHDRLWRRAERTTPLELVPEQRPGLPPIGEPRAPKRLEDAPHIHSVAPPVPPRIR